MHGAVKRTIEALKASVPFIYRNLHPEMSLTSDPLKKVHYGQMGTTRLDIVEDRREDMGAVCNYDIKTGLEGLTLRRPREIADRIEKNYPGAMIYIIQVRPRP